ncbi:hypothetical protein Nhal_2815 [Nitrosococcus halophilus Nc 4]|uniref:Uncharacterized protein n=1 Tax=Nitrosococcus halophilus (strain Nc4) TaxID=472759 RepID=D5BXW9_NITHN|nr:hypothetical protein [Nitrosococcus halophilus]ADE15880.1 hypothetical protein Nhal_2815 [Nitrosococcus halophilus Nc 4]
MSLDEDNVTRATEVAKAEELLPAWFIERMMNDTWFFGVLLDTGQMLGIEHINKVRQAANGDVWIDVEMLEHRQFRVEYLPDSWKGVKLLCSPTSRTDTSINTRHIVAVFDLADTSIWQIPKEESQ